MFGEMSGSNSQCLELTKLYDKLVATNTVYRLQLTRCSSMFPKATTMLQE